MLTEHPRVIITLGFVLVLFGGVAPWLMVTSIAPTSFALCFLSYGASVAGMMLGLIGTALKAETRPA
ncbi:MAG: hypothetical protein JXM73_17735 [Anaerolineae bacterium]|nr:hypothetical protein [Anaerolineae bacterium]